MTPDEVQKAYFEVITLCRVAIANHPSAPDLWIVRNRLIVALLGLWKTDADPAKLDESEKLRDEIRAQMETTQKPK